MKMIYKCLIILLTIGMLSTSCRRDRFDEEIIENPINDPNVTTENDITGLILDETATPLAGAKIQFGDRATITDERGVFILKKAPISNKGSMIKVESDGFFENYRTITPNKAEEKLYIELQMTSLGDVFEFNTSEKAFIETNGGGKITFPENSIMKENGEAYSGQVQVYAHYYDPSENELAVNSPASLNAINSTGDRVSLLSYSMMGVKLLAPDGSKLQVATGKTAIVEFPIPTEFTSNAPENIPLWTVDEETGLWVEEGQAQKDGNLYKGEVSHFSFWNCDIPTTFVEIEGYLQLTDGTPVSNYPIIIARDNLGGAVGYTNNAGYFKGFVPDNETLTMYIWHCGVLLVDMEIGPFSEDTDLGTITTELTDYTTIVSGNLVGCSGESLDYAYGYANYQAIFPASDGSFSKILVGCGSDDIEAQFYDGQNIHTSEIYPIDKSIAENDLGNVIVCGNVDNYITFKVDDGVFHLIENPKLYIINNEKIHLRGNNTLNGDFFTMDINTITTGTFNPEKTVLISEEVVGQTLQGSAFCDNVLNNGDYNCDNFETEITSFDLPGNIVSGTFEGELHQIDSSFTNEVFQVEGSFLSEITKEFTEASVSGRVWIDLNENGIRDAEEDDTFVNNVWVRIEKTNGEQIYFATSQAFPGADMIFSFDNLEPSEYILKVYSNGYGITDYQAGNAEIDNDFKDFGPNQEYATDPFILTDGQSLENIDLGLVANSNLSLGIGSWGCTPEINIYASAAKGVPPYTFELSNGESQVQNNSANFIVTNGGLYSVTVTDATGNSGSVQMEALDYTNQITGVVWNDLLGGQENIWDFAEDEILEGITVILNDNMGAVVQTAVTDKNGYRFTNFPYGDYYLTIEKPSGFEFVDQVPGNNNASCIDPVTEVSDVFNFSDCGLSIPRNIGLKE